MAVFLVSAALIAQIWVFPPQPSGTVHTRGILGAPDLAGRSAQSIAPGLVGVAQGAEVDNSAVVTQEPSVLVGGNGLDGGSQPSIDSTAYNDATIQDPGISIMGSSVENANATSDNTTSTASLPNFNRNFIMPTKGYNYGILHNYNAVDIANSCGTPVVAAAAGVVVPDPNIPDISGDWNGGYGNFILIQHSFGNDVLTRYAHLEQVMVQIGDVVKQGQEIGLMGETGDATGCHVHFEVIGARNPFAKS